MKDSLESIFEDAEKSKELPFDRHVAVYEHGHSMMRMSNLLANQSAAIAVTANPVPYVIVALSVVNWVSKFVYEVKGALYK